MTDINNNQIIFCPNCDVSITVDELGGDVNANPETKKQAIEEQFQLWGGRYDRNYLIQNVVFCPNCHKVSHFKDCMTDRLMTKCFQDLIYDSLNMIACINIVKRF